MTKLTSNTSYLNETFSKIILDNQEFDHIEFERCIFKDSSLVKTILRYCKFIDCQFIGCTLSAVNFSNSNVLEAKFTDGKAIGIDWTLAQSIRSLEFLRCEVSYSNFRFLKLPQIKMLECVVHEADFTETDMHEGKFQKTDFAGTTFFKTNLTKADFTLAFNYSIDARTNTIKQARFSLPEAASLLRSLEIVLE